MNISIQAPLNRTGYGVASLNTIKSLAKIDNTNISYFPLGSPNVDNADDHKLFSRLIQNSITFDPNAPFIKIWHQFDLASRIGRGKYFAYPFFELDTFNDREKLNMSVPDVLFVTTEWAKNVVRDNSIKTETVVVPLGVDKNIFNHEIIKKNRNDNKYVFLNIGKWELRKGHDILSEIFNKAFPTESDVELWVLASENTNNYSSKEELIEWKKLYNNSRIKLFNGLENHHQIAQLMANADCGIYPSRAEGWNLELLEMMAMNKPVITTNYSSHTEFCNNNNSYLVEIDTLEKAYDGKAFTGQGNWAKIESKQIDQFIEYMRYCYQNRIDSNSAGIETATKYNWHSSANIIKRCIDHYN